MTEKFRTELGIDISSILIPAPDINLEKWSVIACDQYTSEPLYWEKVKKICWRCTINLPFDFSRGIS